MSPFRIAKGIHDEEIKIPITRNINPDKYDTLFEGFDPDKKPIINGPEPLIGERHSPEQIDLVWKIMKHIWIMSKILPYVLQKYPKLIVDFRDFINGIRAFVEYIKPLADNRWDRSWVDWTHISLYAEKHGYNAASRKFPVLKDGKYVYHSPRHIRKKVNEVHSFLQRIQASRPLFLKYGKKLRKVIRNDEDLMEKYHEFGKEYEGTIQQLLNAASNGNRKASPYIYYYIRHYDREVYQKKKSDYQKRLIKKKSRIAGKIECGPFKEEQLPAEAIEKVQLQKQIKEVLKNSAYQR